MKLNAVRAHTTPVQDPFQYSMCPIGSRNLAKSLKIQGFGIQNTNLLTYYPLRIIHGLLEARRYRPVGSRPLFLLRGCFSEETWVLVRLRSGSKL